MARRACRWPFWVNSPLVSEWGGWLDRFNDLPEVHCAQRLWNVAEAAGHRVSNIDISPGPTSLSDQLLVETAMVYLVHIIFQGRAIAVVAAEVGLRRLPTRIIDPSTSTSWIFDTCSAASFMNSGSEPLHGEPRAWPWVGGDGAAGVLAPRYGPAPRRGSRILG